MTPTMNNISIIGRGNVAFHLSTAFKEVGICACMVNPHTLDGLPSDSDLYLICVADDAISSVAHNLGDRLGRDRIVVHTSGSVPIDILTPLFNKCGVLYPLQTFSKERSLDYSAIPFFIEGSCEEVTKCLTNLASKISKSVELADSNRRKLIHVAAVFACNFTNHMLDIADSILQCDYMDIRILMPLIKETINKAETLCPHDAQTGPAKRQDHLVMKAHENLLKGINMDNECQIYKMISTSIIDRYK